MELQDFLNKFIELFADEDPSDITPDTDFHELNSWSSLTGLSLVMMIFQEYGVEVESKDIRDADTIEDLYNLVKERMA
jgi:acyl carrier protein